MGIRVEDGGMFTTVQDEGRFGYQQFGMTTAGPMDRYSFHLANILVSNPKGEAALEISMIGPKLRIERDNVMAITGGDLGPLLNGKPAPMYQAFQIKKGDLLSFTGMKNGCRGYLAFAGGLDIPVIMGSKATLVRNEIGGVEGGTLKAGDEIGFSKPQSELPGMGRRKLPQDLFAKKEVVLRVVLGLQRDAFTREGIRQFFWHSARITAEFDRQGCRLECDTPIEHVVDGNTMTDGIVCGSIQVPSNGMPIIMLADHQTTGGYTKIGTVISTDIRKLAQSIPGMRVRFVEVSMNLAQQLYIREIERENEWMKKIEGEVL
mgnify:FL=1